MNMDTRFQKIASYSEDKIPALVREIISSKLKSCD
jgi:hypothetical protein